MSIGLQPPSPDTLSLTMPRRRIIIRFTDGHTVRLFNHCENQMIDCCLKNTIILQLYHNSSSFTYLKSSLQFPAAIPANCDKQASKKATKHRESYNAPSAPCYGYLLELK